jgi:hypothetical protein
MWRRLFTILVIVLVAAAGADHSEAAKKKKKKVAAPKPAVTKPIYEAPMRVVVVRSSDSNCEPLCPEWIAAEGEITGSSPGQFRKVFKQIGKKNLPIIIRSPGGSINAALEIGRMIRKRKADVSLGWTAYSGCSPDNTSCTLPKENKGIYRGIVIAGRAFCNSACHLVLAGGTTRLASAETYLGVHQPRTVWTREIITYRETYRMVKGKKKVISRKVVGRKPGKTRVTYGHDKRLRKQLTAYYKEMGISPKVLEESDQAQHKDINYLSGSELNDLGLRTGPFGPEFLVGPKVCRAVPAPSQCVTGDSAKTPAATDEKKLPGA